jgi:hypothetical protein
LTDWFHKKDEVDPSKSFYVQWMVGLNIDDILNGQALAIDKHLDEEVQPLMKMFNKQNLICLLKLGAQDPATYDKNMDASTRSNQFAAVCVECLWEELRVERTRVHWGQWVTYPVNTL